MALSIFTSGSSMAYINALNKSNSMLSTAMECLGTASASTLRPTMRQVCR